MINQILIEPSNQTFAELMGNSARYTVPCFQRDYSWEQEQWEDLWNDIVELKEEGSHYMGYVVLQQKEKHLYEIIDGQQRFVTLTMIILVSMAQLRKIIVNGIDVENNDERLQEIEKRFIGTKNLITLNVDSRLTLNRNNNSFFKGICANLEPSNPRGITKTNNLLRKVFEFFASKINYTDGKKIAEFIEFYTSSLIFTKIVVQDSLNAYKVFETLNARGVMLSTPDLIKNYLFSVVTKGNTFSDADLDDMDERWSTIVTQLGEQNFTDFVRYLYNSRFQHTTKKDLFKSVREQYSTPKKAGAYLKSLEVNAPLYASLLTPYEEWWNSVDGEYKKAIPFLEGLVLFSIQQPLVVLLAAFSKFTAQEFVLLAKYLFILSVRYNIICNDSPNEQEKKYNKMAVRISTDEYKRASHVKNGEEFKLLYPSDERFHSSFQFYKIPSRRSSRKIRFLLAQIEIQNGREIDFEKATLEHVCPYNPDSNWHKAFGEGIKDVSDRLGNMVLLDRDELKRAGFLEKKKAYQESGNRLALEVSKYQEWTLASVNKYQEWLASQAVKTWRVD
ncbi:MAG: DUF262 domain-containing protein [Candidatus Riflebacteria bacterium]|nr:DUF262 domain-containing protein [Candidatus Riflebacteria bacterium]